MYIFRQNCGKINEWYAGRYKYDGPGILKKKEKEKKRR
jgi:hypothetical protein